MTQITDILPRYTQLNAIVRNVIHRNKILFSEQQFVTDFYRQFADIQLFERMLIGLNGTNGYQVLFNSLKTEIENNISLISSNLYMLERLNIEWSCREYANQFEAEIEVHTRAVNKKWKEYSYVNNLVDMIGYRAQSKEEEERLWEEHARLKEKHDAGQKKLQELYEKQKEAEKTALEYSENRFLNVLSLSKKFIIIVEKYLPKKQAIPQSGIYFDMAVVSAIHKECNDGQFEDIPELDLYAVLNLLPSSRKLSIKSGQKLRFYYLIYKLYEYLPNNKNTMWRKDVLQSLNISEKIHGSKCGAPKRDDAPPESKEFVKRIDELFKRFES